MTCTLSGERKATMIAALAGGWVADAASLGLHWLYDSRRIHEVGGASPEFLTPKADYFKGGFGYFAHEGKQSGDISHYGAATGVLTDSLLAHNGTLDIRDYQQRFQAFFGPGGRWQGYIDKPTRGTLENLGTIKQKDIDHNQLAESGADDMQLPAISKLPPLVASYYGSNNLLKVTEAAVRVTNHNDEAVAWAKCTARLLEQLYRGNPMPVALDAGTAEAPARNNLTKARTGTVLDAPGAGDTFGRTCSLGEAMPVIFHILSHASSYTEAVRTNIQCGGDSCGRAWVIGPAMAALYGVGGERGIPLSWLARLRDAPAIITSIESLAENI